MDIRAASEMGGLLEEDGVWAKDLTDIDRDFELLGGKDRVHDRDVRCGEVRRDGEDE